VPALISATSGSTGLPKLVVHHRRAIAFQAWGNIDLLGATAAAPVSPYGLVGLAVERLAITGSRNPYGSTVGLRAGLGARWRLRDRLIFAEVAPHVALTDFGTGRDFDVGVRVPLVVGIAF
jgi:acyl-CoA synthetase (AMP-forming)/AMP-acid ligase II